MAGARLGPSTSPPAPFGDLAAHPARRGRISFDAGVLGAFVGFALLDGVVRARVQRRRTGDSGVRRPVTVEQWAARLSFAAGLLATGVGGPVVELTGRAPLGALDRTGLRRVGLGLALVGLTATSAAQQAMGDAWRTTAAPGERTELVTTGPYRHIRNPIYASVMVMAAGLTLAVPNAMSVTGLVLVAVGSQWQVTRIEEPYLRRTHPDSYPAYARRVGRFHPRRAT